MPSGTVAPTITIDTTCFFEPHSHGRTGVLHHPAARQHAAIRRYAPCVGRHRSPKYLCMRFSLGKCTRRRTQKESKRRGKGKEKSESPSCAPLYLDSLNRRNLEIPPFLFRTWREEGKCSVQSVKSKYASPEELPS